MISANKRKAELTSRLSQASNSTQSLLSRGGNPDSSSTDAQLVVDDCVHISADYAAKHERLLRVDKDSIATEIEADLNDLMSASCRCCHLDRSIQAEQHLMAPPLPSLRLSRQMRKSESAGSEVSGSSSRASSISAKQVAASVTQIQEDQEEPQEKKLPEPSRVKAASHTSVTLVEEKTEQKREKVDFIIPTEPGSPDDEDTSKPQRVKHRTISEEDTDDFEERSPELDKCIRKLIRIFKLSETDARAVTEGTHYYCRGDVSETRRIILALAAGDRRRSNGRRKTRSFNRRQSVMTGVGETESSSGQSRAESTIVVEAGPDRSSKHISKQTFQTTDTTCLWSSALEFNELTRTPQLEAGFLRYDPFNFSEVLPLHFEIAPIRLLRLDEKQRDPSL